MFEDDEGGGLIILDNADESFTMAVEEEEEEMVEGFNQYDSKGAELMSGAGGEMDKAAQPLSDSQQQQQQQQQVKIIQLFTPEMVTPLPAPSTPFQQQGSTGEAARLESWASSSSMLSQMGEAEGAGEAGARPAASAARGDPANTLSLSGSCMELRKAYKALEESILGVFGKAASAVEVGEADEAEVLSRLHVLNSSCDELRVIVQRKKDILAVERALVRRTDRERQDNPQDFCQAQAENLCLSRSMFQKVLLQ
jgi:hypothetical protein